jgi:hypothetical protein
MKNLNSETLLNFLGGIFYSFYFLILYLRFQIKAFKEIHFINTSLNLYFSQVVETYSLYESFLSVIDFSEII